MIKNNERRTVIGQNPLRNSGYNKNTVNLTNNRTINTSKRKKDLSLLGKYKEENEDNLLILNELNFNFENFENYDNKDNRNNTILSESEYESEKDINHIQNQKEDLQSKNNSKPKMKNTSNLEIQKSNRDHFKNNKIKTREKFNEKENKSDILQDNKINPIRTYEDEKRINNLNLMKNDLYKKLKTKKQENSLRQNEKKYQILSEEIKNEFTIKTPNRSIIKSRDDDSILNQNKNFGKKKESKKLSKKQINKKSKRLERYLKFKKIKKQIKKKEKAQSNFLLTKSFTTNHKIFLNNDQNLRSTDWKFLLEDQIKKILVSKITNYSIISKTIINNFETTPFFYIESEETQDSNLNKLKLFNGAEFKDKNIKSKVEDIKQDDNKQDREINNSNSILNFENQNNKENLLNKLKDKLTELKNKGNFLEEAKNILMSSKADKENNKIDLYNNVNKFSNTITVDSKGINQLTEDNKLINPFEQQIQKTTQKLEPSEKMKIKQRIVNYSLNTYDKFDLKKILVFWRSNMHKEEFKTRIRSNVKPLKQIKEEEETKKIKEQIEIKAENKKKFKEVHVKQSFAQPSENLKKLIPFCNNIYTIQKNES